MKAFVLATRNKGKETEIREIFKDSHFLIWSVGEFPQAPEDIEETGATLEENALLKARHIHAILNLPVVADDTGLEVAALNNAPGVYSARYAGENVTYADNNRKLLQELHGVPLAKRKARFRCVAAFVSEGVERTIDGVCSGIIGEEMRGTGGFGYDPLFIPDGYDQTFAELGVEIKNRMSHRAKAFKALREYLETLDF